MGGSPGRRQLALVAERSAGPDGRCVLAHAEVWDAPLGGASTRHAASGCAGLIPCGFA
jgi:hypothetical protein